MSEEHELTAIEALAQSWASIDGKLKPFLFERDNDIPYEDPRYTGHYDGYMIEAETMIERLRARGYELVKLSPIPAVQPDHPNEPAPANSDEADSDVPATDPPRPYSDQRPGFQYQEAPEGHRVRRSAKMRITG